MGNILRVNNVWLPDPSELEVSLEPMVADGAGRTQAGNMVARLVGKAWTLKVTYSALRDNDISAILQTLSPVFGLNVYFFNPQTRTWVTKKMYTGTQDFSWKRITATTKIGDKLKFSLIEENAWK